MHWNFSYNKITTFEGCTLWLGLHVSLCQRVWYPCSAQLIQPFLPKCSDWRLLRSKIKPDTFWPPVAVELLTFETPRDDNASSFLTVHIRYFSGLYLRIQLVSTSDLDSVASITHLRNLHGSHVNITCERARTFIGLLWHGFLTKYFNCV
jgi:hypothetical protein